MGVAVAAFVVVIGWWAASHRSEAREAAATNPIADRLRKAQALAINEPNEETARDWERAARAYRAQCMVGR